MRFVSGPATVQDLAQGSLARPPSDARRRRVRLDQSPFGIGQISSVTHSCGYAAAS